MEYKTNHEAYVIYPPPDASQHDICHMSNRFDRQEKMAILSRHSSRSEHTHHSHDNLAEQSCLHHLSHACSQPCYSIPVYRHIMLHLQSESGFKEHISCTPSKIQPLKWCHNIDSADWKTQHPLSTHDVSIFANDDINTLQQFRMNCDMTAWVKLFLFQNPPLFSPSDQQCFCQMHYFDEHCKDICGCFPLALSQHCYWPRGGGGITFRATYKHLNYSLFKHLAIRSN